MGLGDGAGAAEEVEEFSFGWVAWYGDWAVERRGVGLIGINNGSWRYCVLLLGWDVVDE